MLREERKKIRGEPIRVSRAESRDADQAAPNAFRSSSKLLGDRRLKILFPSNSSET